MLVVSRESGESLTVNDATLTVVLISENYLEASLYDPETQSTRMLTLSPGEYVHISKEIRVVLVRIGKNRVRLGFDYPSCAMISRPELDR